VIVEELSRPPDPRLDQLELVAPVEKPAPARHRRYYDCGCLANIARLILWANRNNRR
jgi:hypothetical protein